MNQKSFQLESIPLELLLETARSCGKLQNAFETVRIKGRENSVIEVMKIDIFARSVPAILSPKRIVCLGDFCAEKPEWWRANKLHFFCPELSAREIGEILNLRARQVRDFIKYAEISSDCYENLPEIK